MPATPGQARPLPNALYFRNQELQNDASVEVGRQKCLVRDFALPGCSLPDFRTKQARLSASTASFAAATAGRECMALSFILAPQRSDRRPLSDGRGTPQQQLVDPEDLFDAKIVDATPKAKELGVRISMTGREAVEALLKASSNDR